MNNLDVNLEKQENNLDNLEKTDLLKLEEIEFDKIDDSEVFHLKKRKDVYLEMYKKARQKAIQAKKNAIKAFLEAKNIKETYLIDDIESSDEELDLDDNILFRVN